MNLVFMSSTSTGCRYLRFLHAHSDVDRIYAVTCPDSRCGRGRKITPSPVAKYCVEKGVDIIKPKDINSSHAVNMLKSYSAQLCFVVDYGQILSSEVLSLFPLGCFNIHYSLLPDLRGPDPVRHALLKGYEKTGVSLIKMNEKIDSGEILASKEVKITPEDNFKTLKDRLTSRGIEILDDLVEKTYSGEVPSGRSQLSSKNLNYAGKLSKEMCQIDWNLSAHQVFSRIRSLSPAPGCRTFHEKEKKSIIITDAEIDENIRGKPGMVSEVSKRCFKVACGEGGVKVLRVKPAGKREMDVSSFLAGNQIEKGDMFR